MDLTKYTNRKLAKQLEEQQEKHSVQARKNLLHSKQKHGAGLDLFSLT